MTVNFIEQGDEQRREAAAQVLPEIDLISSILYPRIEKVLFPVLVEILKAELEVYRKYPKKPLETVEKAKEAAETFDPQNNRTCFMGKGFKANSDFVDSELAAYRKAIGTIKHPVWGDCTLLEIWGGDHFEKHTKMVKAAFEYGAGIIDKLPKLKFYVNPLFVNKGTGKLKLSEEQKQYEQDMELLLAKAMVFGVNEPKKRRR